MASPSINLYPNIEPLPRASLTAPNKVKAKAKPNPIPNPSISEEIKLCFEAKPSALPKTIQFTTISGINIPSASKSAGANPSIISSTIVTKEAIITIKEGILTLSGIKFLINDITIFEQTSTNIVASPIPNPLIADEVTANVGHNPKSNTKTGLSFINPLLKFFH